MTIYSRWPIQGSGSGGVTSLNGETGALTLVAGSNITITPSGTNITISSTGGGGTGTVTSVGLAAPSIFTVSGSPVTTAGTLTFSLNSEAANTFFAAPNGSAGTPTLRLIVPADVPTLNQNTTGTASNITATSNSTLTSLPSLVFPTSQLSGTIALGSQVSGILPVANGGTDSGTTLVNGQVMVSNGGQIVENPNFYSVYGGALTIGAPNSNPELGATDFGIFKVSTTTASTFEYPQTIYYELTPASTQTGDYASSTFEIALNPSPTSTAMNGFYYGLYIDAAAQNGIYGGPVIGQLNFVHFDNTSSGVLSLGQQITVINDGTGEVHNSWGVSIDTVQATGVGPNPHRAALLMLGDHTFLGAYDGATASGSTVSNECDAIYVRAGCLNATGTNATNWVINSQETHPSQFLGSISAVGLFTTTLQVSTGAVTGDVLTSDVSGNATWQSPSAGVIATASASATKKVIYVSQDVGSNSNDGSIFAPFLTIQAGINKANTIAAFYNQVIVNVTPSGGTLGYQENITLSQQGVTVQAFSPLQKADTVYLNGSCTINLTGTSGGTDFIAASNNVYLKGLIISPASGNSLIFTGTVFQRLYLDDCYVNSLGTSLIMTNTGTNGGTNSTITSRDTDFINSSATLPTIELSAGNLFISGANPAIQNSNAAASPSITIDGASATGGVFSITNGTINGQVTVSDNLADAFFNNTSIASGASPSIVTASSPNTGFVFAADLGLTTTATNSVIGSGVIVLSGVAKLSTGGDIATSVTQVVISSFPQGAVLLGATATQTANVLLTLKNGHIKSEQTTVPTVTATNSGTFTTTLSNATDIAGKINYTPGAGVTVAATVTVTFNQAYNVAPIISITPANTNAGTNAVQFYTTSTTTGFTLNFVASPVATLLYNWFYNVIETQ